MLEAYSTNAIAAKVRTIYGTMLTQEDFREMVAKRSIQEVAELLRHTKRYSEILRDVDPNSVHRGFLEHLISAQNYKVYRKLCDFENVSKPFYSFLLKKHECMAMINLVNAIRCDLRDDFVRSVPAELLENSHIPFLKLARCSSIDEASALLRGSSYGKLLKKAQRTGDGKIDFTDAEIRLRTDFYNELISDVKESGLGNDEEELLKLIRSEIDVINLINAYRLKAYFGYTPDEIKKTVLPFTQMGKTAMNRFYECETPAQMMKMVEKSSFGKFFSEGEENIEPPLIKRTLTSMRHTLARSTSAPVALYAFMYICDNELRNIVRVIEGVRYDVEPATIFKLLIF